MVGSQYMGFKYVRVLNIPGLSICQGSELPGLTGFTYFGKDGRILNMRYAVMEGFRIFQDSKYARFLNVFLIMPWVVNKPELRIWQACEYSRVTQDADYV